MHNKEKLSVPVRGSIQFHVHAPVSILWKYESYNIGKESVEGLEKV